MTGRGTTRKVAARMVSSPSTWKRWGEARASAARWRQPVYRGLRIEWDVPGHAWTVPFDLPGPGPSEVLVRTHASTVSMGTERAFFSRAPNAFKHFPSYPGYSAAGVVVRCGANVRDLAQGSRVAFDAKHQSAAVLDAGSCYVVADSVDFEDAAFVTLGVIAQHGVWQSAVGPRDRVVVLGRGSVGQLATQLISLEAREVISIAPTDRHVTAELEARATIVTTGNGGMVSDCGAQVTLETSGAPGAIAEAVAATRDGGRVILLGSPRGDTQVDFLELARRKITIVGAHASTLERNRNGQYNTRTAAERFLSLLEHGEVTIGELISARVDPFESGWFYRSLLSPKTSWVGAVFKWDQVDDADALQRVAFLSPPEQEHIRGRDIRPITPPGALLG